MDRDPLRLVRMIRYAVTGIATALLLIEPVRQGEWQMVGIIVVIGLLGTLSIVRAWRQTLGTVTFTAFVLLSGFEALQGASPLVILLAIASALAAWDLHSFASRTREAGAVERASLLVRGHLMRLAAVAGLGLGLGGAARVIRLDYGVGVVVGLALLLAIGLSQAISHIRRESD